MGTKHRIEKKKRKKQHLFTINMLKPQDKLFREVVESPSLEILRNKLDTALSNQGCSRWSPEVPSDPHHQWFSWVLKVQSFSSEVNQFLLFRPHPSCRYFRVSCHSTLSLLSIFSSLFCILPAEKLQFVILPSASYFFLKVNTMSCL